jgi:hypothetical protein
VNYIKQITKNLICGYGREDIYYRVSKETNKENVHLKAILFLKCGCPYLCKSPCKGKIPEAVINEIRVASVRRT